MKTILLTVASVMSVSALGSEVWELGARVNFDLERAGAVGTGCSEQDLSQPSSNIRILTGDRYLAVITKAISIDLSSFDDAALAERKNCAIRIPASISAGHTIRSITQRAHYGAFKTEGATLALSFRVATFSSVAQLNKSFAREDAVYRPISTLSATTELSEAQQQSLCNNRSFIQKIDFAASSQLFSAGSEVSVGRMGSGDTKVEVSFDVVPCSDL